MTFVGSLAIRAILTTRQRPLPTGGKLAVHGNRAPIQLFDFAGLAAIVPISGFLAEAHTAVAAHPAG